ncbi:zinc-binding oxidoreductase [Hyaloscypha finlandica]|nr:zinc-binding oxidoreductase [Hyaloscypha finlandica]
MFLAPPWLVATTTAVVIHQPGGPEILKLQQWPKPVPTVRQVLIRVKAFGLGRSEIFGRQGHWPGVIFPRILGIEAVGFVEESPGGEFKRDQVQVIKPKISLKQLGVLPEMMQTAWSSLIQSLQQDTVLIRGGTTSVGLATAALAKSLCSLVAAATRKPEREAMLLANGASEVFIDNGTISEEVRKRHSEGFSKILDLVGVTVLEDTLKCAKECGIICMTGIAGGESIIDNSDPHIIPNTICLTTYSSSPQKFMETPLNEIVEHVADGSLIDAVKTFRLRSWKLT